MLSPASHRVCCLAVMAPALTKADRRTDCLPVELSEPFCVSETTASVNREDKINEFALSKIPKVAYLLKRKPYMYKTCFRNYIKNSTDPSNDLRKSLLNSKFRIYAEPKSKSWHGTSATLAVADKVRSKYIMNKANNSFKNMGLARANTTLGLHSMRKMNRITPISHRDKDDPTGLIQETGEISPDLPDTTNSELETAFTISRIVQPASEQSSGEVSSSCGDLLVCSDPELDASPSAMESDNQPFAPNTSTKTVSVPENSSISLSSASRKDGSAVSPRDDNLPVTLTDTDSLPGKVKNPDARESGPSNCTNSFVSLPPAPCFTSVTNNISKSQSETNSFISLPHCENSLLPVTDVAEVELKESSSQFDSLASQVEPTPLANEALPLSEENLASPLSPKESDIETASASCSFSSSSTLSANASPVNSFSSEALDSVFVTFPDAFLGTASGVPPTEIEIPVYMREYAASPRKISCSNDEDSHFPGDVCCHISNQDFTALQEALVNQEARLCEAIEETEGMMRQYSVTHVKEQITTLVEHCQKKLSVPCQKPIKLAVTKPIRDIVGLKAELLQSEGVKNLSTAALVNFVRKLESSSSPGNLLIPQKLPSPDNEVLPDVTAVPETFSSEDFADIKQKSQVLVSNLKALLSSADPDLTESSDEESSDMELEESESSAQKSALWNFMKERAALTSRSTWLIARIHELENQLRTVTGYLKKVSSSVGEVCFEEQGTSESSALSTAGSGDASLQTAIRQTKTKHLSRPVNGYLDHSSISGPTPYGHSSDALRLERKPSSAPPFVESCSRTRPLKTSSFYKRKLLVTTGLHMTDSKLAKLSTVGCVCNCQEEMLPCVLCTGRYNCAQSVDPDSLPLLDRVALLDPNFHPLLSFDKDIPLLVHFESILKKNEAQYQSVRPVSPIPNHGRLRFGTKQKHFSDARSRSRKLNRYARSLLSAKYRNKKHFRKHKLVFGKWRKLQNKSSFQARDRIRRLSIASSGSSHDSPVDSPMSQCEDGMGFDSKRRRDDNQFDIDDVIIPYSSKRGRLVKFEFKDIEIPSWRSKDFGDLESTNIAEDTSDAAFIKRHEGYEVEERKIIRNGGDALCFFNTWQKRARRQHRSDSRADSSGANTPDPTLLCDQDMFQDPNSLPGDGSSPMSPAISPPMTPSSANLVSDDSQPSLGNFLMQRSERKKPMVPKRPEETSTLRLSVSDYIEVPPYEPRVFPLSDEVYEQLLAESDHNKEDVDIGASGPSCPASPVSSTSSTTTVDEEDITDPEWTVVKKESPDQALVLKFAKR